MKLIDPVQNLHSFPFSWIRCWMCNLTNITLLLWHTSHDLSVNTWFPTSPQENRRRSNNPAEMLLRGLALHQHDFSCEKLLFYNLALCNPPIFHLRQDYAPPGKIPDRIKIKSQKKVSFNSPCGCPCFEWLSSPWFIVQIFPIPRTVTFVWLFVRGWVRVGMWIVG